MYRKESVCLLKSITWTLVVLKILPESNGFSIVHPNRIVDIGHRASSSPLAKKVAFSQLFLSKNKKEEEDEEEEKKGMAEAFRSLDELSELKLDDGDDDSTSFRDKLNRAVTESDDISAKDTASADTSAPSPTTEEQMKIYADMQKELEESGEDQMYEDILGELSGKEKKPAAPPAETKEPKPPADIVVDEETILQRTSSEEPLFEDADGIGTRDDMIKSEQKQDILEAAIQEAVEQARSGEAKDVSSESLLEDKEMMKDIERVFDEANQKLLDAVEEIRRDQAKEAQMSAEQRQESLVGDEARLQEAQGSISRLLSKVEQETQEVQSAVKDLEAAQRNMDDDPIMKLVNLKEGGLVKQSTLVLSFLFLVRSLSELVFEGFGGGVVVQLGLALVFAAIFFFF